MPIYAPNYITGFNVQPDTTDPTHKVSISDGYCKDSTNTWPIVHPDTKYADIEISGAGGLDAGVEAADTWYYVFVIYSTTQSQRNTLLSTSPTDPTMPEGYNLFRRVGSVRNDSGSDFLNFYQFGREGTRECYYREDCTDLEVLTNGAAQVFTDVDLSSLMPTTSNIGLIGLQNQNAIRDMHTRPDGFSMNCLFGVCCGRNNNYSWMAVETRILEYRLDGPGGGAYIWVLGYKEEV